MAQSAAVRVRAEAERIGAALEERGGRNELDINIWLSPGRVCVATGGHSLSAHYFSDREAGWKDVLDDMRLGTESCVDPGCDTCLGL